MRNRDLLWRTAGTLVLGYLLVGCATPQPTPVSVQPTKALSTIAPSLTRTPLPTLTASASSAAIAQAAQNTQPANVAATSTPGAVRPTSTSALVAATKATTPVATQPLLVPGNAPPISIRLPAGWKFGYSVVPIRESLIQSSMNLALYTGPVKTGQGTILVLWGFPSVGAPPTIQPPGPTATNDPAATPLDYQSQLLWSDGLRLLTGTVFDITCNTAQYGQRTFTVGGKNAIGTYFNASQCPNTPDTLGWFAVLNQFGGNYMFVMYVDPYTAYNDSRGDLQAIIDTVEFHAPAPAATAPAAPTKPAGPPPTNTPQSP